MSIKSRHFFISVAVYALGFAAAFAAAAPNPRAAVSANATVSSARADGRAVNRTVNSNTSTGGASVTSRVASTNIVSRASLNTVSRSRAASTNTVSRAASNTVSRAGVSRAASNTVSRAATSNTASRTARAGVSRAATTARAAARAMSAQSRAARATAVFNDISKIGGGYAACRESYATCMDQFCANANDTYRRCFCSSKYTEMRDTEEALSAAQTLIAQFENNNLAAVSLSEGEANAMYTATIGEEAIKNDTSKSAELLGNISDLLSGKKKAPASNGVSDESLGLLKMDSFSLDMDDIWGGSSSGLFENEKPTDYSTLSGLDLYNDAHKQCMQLTDGACESSAVLNMAVSAYNIMITQDCNAYQKKIDTQRTAIEQTVNTAEKYLREARLADYRSHNSADVNECLDKVRTAILSETACGEDYHRCLDHTGAYVNSTTGEAIYSPRLFKLNELINLNGSSGDVLAQNQDFNDFLESRKMFANTALDTCRDISETVWTEFKRVALIEIAQAQDELIEEVKNTCVATMTECYNTQTGALEKADNTTAQSSAAMGAMAARDMCADKVMACAALYGDEDGCDVDAKTGKVTNKTNKKCGLESLLNFVSNVDNVRIAEGCQSSIEKELKTVCTDSDKNYPWGCRTMQIGSIEYENNTIVVSAKAAAGINSYRGGDSAGGGTANTLAQRMLNFALANCTDSNLEPGKGADGLSSQTILALQRSIQTVSEELDSQLQDKCLELDGYWMATETLTEEGKTKDARATNNSKLLLAFYSDVFGGDQTKTSLGVCVENSVRTQCLAQNSDSSSNYAKYNERTDECEFSDEWYKDHCEMIGSAYYEGGVCYVAKQ